MTVNCRLVRHLALCFQRSLKTSELRLPLRWKVDPSKNPIAEKGKLVAGANVVSGAEGNVFGDE